MERNGSLRHARRGKGVTGAEVRHTMAKTSPLTRSLTRATLVALLVLVSTPALAQFDLGGHWARRSNQDDMESGPGPDPVDYLGLPLNDEGRARALSFQYSAVSLPEHQCGYLSPFYIVLGPFGLAIDRVLDPVTARLV